MFTFNGKQYAKNDREIVESLFGSGGTCNGFYKARKGGITLFDIQGHPRVFLVCRPQSNEYFAVSIHKPKDGPLRYMYSTVTTDEVWAGMPTSYLESKESVKMAYESFTKQEGK